MANIRVIARISAQRYKTDELKIALLQLLNPTRAELGCTTDELCHNTDDPADLLFIEEWASAAAIADHMQSAHVRQAFLEAGPLVASAHDIRTYVRMS